MYSVYSKDTEADRLVAETRLDQNIPEPRPQNKPLPPPCSAIDHPLEHPHSLSMSQDNTRHSGASSASFTVSDFDPEHEAMASTRELDFSPRLPSNKIRSGRQRVQEEEPDFAINTSTLENAFPEFSQIQTSEEDDSSNSDMSIEAGRGIAKPARRLDDSRSSVMSFENSVRSSSPAVRVDYPTPQKPAMRSTSRRAVSENLRKDAQLRRASQAQKEAMSPQVSKTQRADQRRSLSEMHAKVRDNYDGSFLGDERPAPVAANSRSTRFSNPHNSQDIADAVERASREAYAKEMRRGSMPNNVSKPAANVTHTSNAPGDTMTRQSFLLPDLPNISELVSGVYEDGTPVFSRQQKMRSTRFVPLEQDATDVSLTREHMPLDAVPIPEDEKALFVSLRLLQDKVSELEMFKSEAEKRLEGYRQENATLKGNRPRNSDRYETDDVDHKRGSKRLASENQKLEAANLALQNQLDIADRKAQVQESAIKRLNHDRESAISQLGAAYLETRELKAENEVLRQENGELKSQSTRISSRKSREQDTVDSDASSAISDAEDSQHYTERTDRSRSTKDVTSKSARSNYKNKRQDDSRAKISTQVNKEISRLEKERAEEALFSIDLPTPKRTAPAKAAKSDTSRPTESKSAKKQPNTGKQRVKRVVVEDVTEPVETTEPTKASSGDDDLTYLTFIDENEIARLRKTLEEERLARKQRRSSVPKDPTATETVNSTRQSILKAPAPRKSSPRESKPAIPRPASAAGDITTESRATTDGDNSLAVPTAERPRRHSDHSVPVISPRKKWRNVEDMTSAFILPDITLHHADLAATNPSRLPEAALKALDGIAQHDGKNCMVCKNVLPNDGSCNHEPVKIPKPVPVSERMPKPSPYNEDPTLRPSQPPAIALATVLKTLEDELSHLKMQLASYQSAYNKLDASLGKRQRKSLLERIDKVLKDVDMKSDQIYSLYDVLEGQKQAGHQMTEQEMEMTLESIGIDVPPVQDVTGITDKSSRFAVPLDLDEDEDELPWEGIESTADMTGRTADSRH
ncbi:hypothetical protein NUU61_005323 [Penicillium alfredii]|uniref:Cep57 centrosome microtubule-binding domain-containing protein n=1 Tax=Penicillium alfredii TaxID=1506179 RepID=A0A9W9F9A0_9EURO|nr:uncharacterized protein NUU61_005323 [Penicillium alfredii]KAJ5095967.1 hypothetical protein NUU61_005323 [Penicillium alfredii]